MQLFDLYKGDRKINRGALNAVQAATMQRLTALNYGYTPKILPHGNSDVSIQT